ncbi:MAG: ABC transporter ATP-binding protein [Eubacteriales bacterium]|nr:ABC transporter ATP-binding protein [Eubacteriales bacterium]
MLELKLDRVTKRFGTKIAVDEMDFILTNGVYGLLGENGAGKTTLMRMMCALLMPDSGEISFCGEEIRRMGAEYRRILGYLPQEFGYYPDFTAERYLKHLAQLKALPPQIIPEKLDEIWELTGLKDAKRQKLKGFSGGMLRRLGIGQALLNNPLVLILDEPTSGLDPKERIRFRNIISSLGKGRIVLLSTHIVQDVEFIADEILFMKGGRLAETGTLQALMQKARGQVWECLVDEEWEKRLNARFLVSNLKYENGQVRLRIVSNEKPVPDAKACEPNLEDVYLYYAGEGRAHGSVSDGII